MSVLGEMWGDRAVQAPFCLIACRRDSVEGIGRTMIGGVFLDDVCKSNQWERWHGTLILIPDLIEQEKRRTASRLEQMMTNNIAIDELWKKQWKRP